jgi:hypothetical protein
MVVEAVGRVHSMLDPVQVVGVDLVVVETLDKQRVVLGLLVHQTVVVEVEVVQMQEVQPVATVVLVLL